MLILYLLPTQPTRAPLAPSPRSATLHPFALTVRTAPCVVTRPRSNKKLRGSFYNKSSTTNRDQTNTNNKQMPSLSSSNLASCDWQPSSDAPTGSYLGTLSITFKSGRTYKYAEVPEEVYRGLLEASSAGRYFNSVIKDTYSEA